MPIIPATGDLRTEQSCVALPRYAQIVQADECGVFGVARVGQAKGCREIWLKRERDAMIHALWQAQNLIEGEVGYPLCRRWFAAEAHAWGNPVPLEQGYVVAGGVEHDDLILADAAVNHATDPAVVGPIATTVTDVNEIRVYYPASLGVEGPVEIHPSDIDISGGVMTITIPRCRLVHPSAADNDRTGLDYTDLANFLSVVDVYRVWNDSSTQACLVWKGGCEPGCGSAGCAEETQTGCVYVDDSRLGLVDVQPSRYSGGSWHYAEPRCTCRPPDLVRVSYLAGRWASLPPQAEDAIVRLAHCLLPLEPCWCDTIHFRWQQDTAIPDVLSRERFNCKFGMQNGAWIAWKWAQGMMLGQGGNL